MTTTAREASLLTTQIGSLPHHNVDAALEYAFKVTLPFLPQIPIRNRWEYMIAQALEGLPGLQVDENGTPLLNLEIWNSRAHEFNHRLADAFARADREPTALSVFEPSAATSSGWQAFVWELTERGAKRAKIQIAGPMTSQWALRLLHGQKLGDGYAEVSTQIMRLVLARALAMVRKLREGGIEPWIYVDEPGLYGFNPALPKHAMGLQELRVLIQTLRKDGARVGLHCCSNTHWPSILTLPIHLLSIDCALSLESVLSCEGGRPFESFIDRGGRLSLGVIPTGAGQLQGSDASVIFSDLLAQFTRWIPESPERIRKILGEAVLTPACGLALHTIPEAEDVLGALIELADLGARYLRDGSG